MRVAVYFAPTYDSLLWKAGCDWFGRDPASGLRCAPALADTLGADAAETVLAAPRRYGFHATLMAPFTLCEPLQLDDAIGALDALARRLAPFNVFLKPDVLSQFLALVPCGDAPELSMLADSVLESFDPLRAPLSPADFERRARGLDDQRLRLLERWGYAHVREYFRFHMTLTGRLTTEDAERIMPLAEAHFAAALSLPVAVNRLALFVEDAAGADFRLHASAALTGQGERASHTAVMEQVSERL